MPSSGKGGDPVARDELDGVTGLPHPPLDEPDDYHLVDEATAEGPQDLWLDWRSSAWIGAAVLVGLLALGVTRNVSTSMTRVGVGLLLTFALDPIVVRIRHRFGCLRGTAVLIVGSAVVALFAFLIFVLGPPAVEQAQKFGRELPDTVEQAYSLPVVGSRLEEADAAGQVREWAANLPARVDTDSIAQPARRLPGGVLAVSVVLLVGITVLVDGDLVVGRLNAALPDGVRPGATRVGQIFYRTIGAYFAGSLLVACLASTYVLTVGLALGIPLAPAAA